MARYRFVEITDNSATVIQHKKNGEQLTQTWTADIGGLAKAIMYAESHGKRQDLVEYYTCTEVVYQGEVVYSVHPEEIV